MTQPTEQQVATVARAIIAAWERIADVPFPLYDREADELARAALTAAAPRQAEGWNEALEAAAKIADEWSHHGDPAVAMYASPRIRDRILRLRRPSTVGE